MSVADDVQEVFERMPEVFLPEKAANLKAVVQLELTGEGGGNWEIKIANGNISVAENKADSADLTLRMAASDYLALTRGEANAVNLFMSGKINLQGDMNLALRFQDMFDRDQV